MIDEYQNKGKTPFIVNPDSGLKLSQMRRKERKKMELGLKKIKCKVPQKDFEGKEPIENNTAPKIIMNLTRCKKCGSEIRVEATYCPKCKVIR